MKYFTLDSEGKTHLGSATRAKRYLREHPEVESVVRWWWSGSDLIEVEDISREQILGKTPAELNRGATAQWAVDHHAI